MCFWYILIGEQKGDFSMISDYINIIGAGIVLLICLGFAGLSLWLYHDAYDAQVGSWNSDISHEITPEVSDMVSKVGDNKYQPVTLLETQVVSGTNYKVLCTEKDTNKYVVLQIYQDLNGNVELSSIKDYVEKVGNGSSAAFFLIRPFRFR